MPAATSTATEAERTAMTLNESQTVTETSTALLA